MVDQTQICPSPISPSGLFQGTCNIEKLKGGILEPKITEGWDLNLEGRPQTSIHTMNYICFRTFVMLWQLGGNRTPVPQSMYKVIQSSIH